MFLKPDLSERGFAVAFTGLVSELGDSFFLQSDAKDFAVTIENLVSVVLADFQLSATIVPRPMSGAEQDLFSGTMVTSNAVLITDANEQEYGGLTRSWDGEGLDAEAIPEGIPRVCSNDPCATMGPAGGDCQMADWSRPAFCD